MRPELIALCENFIESRDVVKYVYALESDYLYPVCAMTFINSNKKAYAQILKDCHVLLKKNVSIFSNFRGMSVPVIASMLAVDDDPHKRLNAALNAYDSLKKHFFADNYLPLTAMIMSGNVAEEQFDTVSAQACETYDLMKKNHPFLTTGEDCVFSLLHTLSGRTPQEASTEIELCFDMLKKSFSSANAVQSLAFVLALFDTPCKEKCDRTVALFDALRENGMKYGTTFELSTLGTLAMLPIDKNQTVYELSEIDEYLASKKGYGFFGIGKRQRLMHAGMILSSAYLTDQTGFVSSAISAASAQQAAILAAQQAAVCAAIAVCAATRSSSN